MALAMEEFAGELATMEETTLELATEEEIVVDQIPRPLHKSFHM